MVQLARRGTTLVWITRVERRYITPKPAVSDGGTGGGGKRWEAYVSRAAHPPECLPSVPTGEAPLCDGCLYPASSGYPYTKQRTQPLRPPLPLHEDQASRWYWSLVTQTASPPSSPVNRHSHDDGVARVGCRFEGRGERERGEEECSTSALACAASRQTNLA